MLEMGELAINCPLCCNSSFNSKQLLIDHLSNLSLNIVCPICSKKFSTIKQLTEHLRTVDCDVNNQINNIIFDDKIVNGNKENSSDSLDISVNDPIDVEDSISSHTVKILDGRDDLDAGKMYVELVSKQLMKPCLQTQELKLIKEDGQSHYVIVSDENSIMKPGVAIVTKQNNDGTISLTTLKDAQKIPELDTKLETQEDAQEDAQEDTQGDTQEENNLETEVDKNQEEIYSCNTCGVSFTSVLDHIQNYHNDQDVVVEESMDYNLNNGINIPIEHEEAVNEEVIADKQVSRRMITETGDIIETPFIGEEESVPNGSEGEVKVIFPVKDNTSEKQQRVVRRYVQVEKFCNSMIKDIRTPDEKNGPYHKVVVKEMHTAEGEKVKVYNCMSCSLYVSSLSEFNDHPCKTLKYPCPHCPVAYENSKSLCAHMKVHKYKGIGEANFTAPTKFRCEICCTIFPTSKSLKLHKRMHDPIKSRPIEPPVKNSWGNAASDDKFLCSICDKLIPIDYRVIHQNSHKTNNKMNCDICNKKFHSKEFLEMHMNVHNLDKVTMGKQDKSLPYTCFYCNRKFARPHEKVKHERIHTGEKPHSCEICGKSFRVSYCLTLHMRTHTGARPYACPHCNKRFKAHSVYNHHLLTHSEVRAYKCPFCPKAFKTSVQLAGHKNSHTKPFSCSQCNRPFASLYAVRAHMEIHTRQNSLKFSCTLCGASYARAFALKDHVRTQHRDTLDTKEGLTILKQEEWMGQENTDVDSDGIQLNKDLPPEMKDLGTNSYELIIP